MPPSPSSSSSSAPLLAPLVDRVLAALYAREPSIKAVVSATGGGASAAPLLFRAGSSSTMLQFTVPYHRQSLARFVSSTPPPRPVQGGSSSTKSCSREVADRMATAAWQEALQVLASEDVATTQAPPTLAQMLQRFHAAVGVGCTVALATNYARRGANQCFLSVCRVHANTNANANTIDNNADDTRDVSRVLSQKCESYRLHLDKSLQRSRQEEDELVSQHLVYVLAQTAGVARDACAELREALADRLHGPEDCFEELPPVGYSSSSVAVDPIAELCATSAPTATDAHGTMQTPDAAELAEALRCVAFLPTTTDGEEEEEEERIDNGVTVVHAFPFQGLVVPGSFNPLHKGHLAMARAAQRVIQRHDGLEALPPVAFELAAVNADKGALPADVVYQRMAQFVTPSTSTIRHTEEAERFPVLVTNAPLFHAKAKLLRDCVFVVGADTAVRLVDKKYYGGDEHRMVLAMHELRACGTRFAVAGRVEKDTTYVSAEEVLRESVPPVLQDLFIAIHEDEFRMDVSSTELRREQQQQQH